VRLPVLNASILQVELFRRFGVLQTKKISKGKKWKKKVKKAIPIPGVEPGFHG
jgi:hypothetical protein